MDQQVSSVPTSDSTGTASGANRQLSQERSVETRAKLVSCAIQCISELGYASATTPRIAQRAGVTRGALQYHFATRADLDLAVIDHVMTELNFKVDAQELSRLPLKERVTILVDVYWDTFTSPAFRAALNIWLGVLSHPPMAQRLRNHLSARLDRIEQSWQLIFLDTGCSMDELRAIRHLVMSSGRGHAVERFFHPGNTGVKERELLVRLTLHALTDRPKQA